MAEHLAIVARENNPERKAFYQLAWYLGASQPDLAFLQAEDADWNNNVISSASAMLKRVGNGVSRSSNRSVIIREHESFVCREMK
ncbi:MAG TPA: hypothetical protein VIK53_06145 [Verrucomicrobiae bacterium]